MRFLMFPLLSSLLWVFLGLATGGATPAQAGNPIQLRLAVTPSMVGS